MPAGSRGTKAGCEARLLDMKKFLAAAMAITALSIGIAAPTSFSLEGPFTATVPLNAQRSERVNLRFAPNAAQLEVRVRGRVQIGRAHV